MTARPEFRYLYDRGWVRIPDWTLSTQVWADRFWGGGWEAYRKARWGTSHSAAHDGTSWIGIYGLIAAGCPEVIARRRAMTSWTLAGGYASTTQRLQDELNPIIRELRDGPVVEEPEPEPEPEPPTRPPTPVDPYTYEDGYAQGVRDVVKEVRELLKEWDA
jgi:hypothetical protein